ncbi:MAG: hypothetical protein ACFFER_14655, partial [Candidatus Thorarchaeota archaeon]
MTGLKCLFPTNSFVKFESVNPDEVRLKTLRASRNGSRFIAGDLRKHHPSHSECKEAYGAPVSISRVEKPESVITPKRITTKIENIVASVILNRELDLEEIAAGMPDV